MFRTYALPLLAAAGLALALYTVFRGGRPAPVAQPVSLPAQAPFESYIAGAGLIEARSENVAIGALVPGVVTQVDVRPGQRVRAGEPLFTIDQRQAAAELATRQAALRAAEAQVARLEALPRAEDIPPAQARVAEAQAALADAKAQLGMWESVADKRAISEEELTRRRYAVEAAQARLEQARAALALLQAGAFAPDLEIARAQAESARAQVAAAQVELDRLTVRAPADGEALQVNIRAGEYAHAGPAATPHILFGDVSRLHVRVDIDENDAWRVRPGAAAVAFVRGNNALRADLRFERLEPYIVPKRSLTGASTERVDTRVLQAIFSFEKGDLPVYVGQQMDVFIDAPPIASPPPAPVAASH